MLISYVLNFALCDDLHMFPTLSTNLLLVECEKVFFPMGKVESLKNIINKIVQNEREICVGISFRKLSLFLVKIDICINVKITDCMLRQILFSLLLLSLLLLFFLTYHWR